MTVQGSLEIQSDYVKGKGKPKAKPLTHDEENALAVVAGSKKQPAKLPDGVTCHMKEDAMHMISSLESMESTILWNLEIAQGSITCLLGRHGDGKGTLLRIIGGVSLPTSGNYFIPPQLRVCFVVQTPVFFSHATLLDTLAFGLTGPQRDDPDLKRRVKLICAEVGVHEEIMTHLDSSQARDWGMCLSMAQLKKIHLARAFIANPEVLVLDRPTAALDAKALAKLCELLQRYVQNRGLVDDGSDANDHLQRPRTVVFTTERIEATAIAHRIFIVKPNGVKQMRHEDVTTETMYDPNSLPEQPDS
jgi:ABC-type sulfate/molybdate transport systems ATPase subunit